MPAEFILRTGPANDGEQYLASLIRADYERCHPGETLADLKRRARFSKGDKGVLRDWMAIARRRAATSGATRAAADSLVGAE